MKVDALGALTGAPHTHEFADSVLWEYMTPTALRRRLDVAPVVYLPVGTLEWHGWHNPQGTDGITMRGLMIDVANTVGGVVMPMLFLGPDLAREHEGRMYYGMDNHDPTNRNWATSISPTFTPRKLEGSAYWVSDDLFAAITEQIIANLARLDVKILVVGGHGPSSIDVPVMSEKYNIEIIGIYQRDEDVAPRVLRAPNDPSVEIRGDHAGAFETSINMYYYPGSVDLSECDNHPDEPLLGVSGSDPRKYASPEVGRMIAETVKQNLTKKINKLLLDMKE